MIVSQVAVKLSASRAGEQPFKPQYDSWYSFLFEAEWIPGHSGAGRMRKVEKYGGNRVTAIVLTFLMLAN
jgi:hypothetical protein